MSVRPKSPDRGARDREQRAQRMLRSIVGASSDAIYVYYVPLGRIAFVGQRMREVLGFAAARSHRLRLAEFEQLVHPQDVAGFRAHLTAIAGAADGEVLSLELRIRSADACYRWLRIRDTVLSRGEKCAVAKVVGVVSDIDARKRAHEYTRGDRPGGERLGDILAMLGDCYIALDRRYRIVDANPKAANWLGERPEDLIGRCYLSVVAPGADHAEAVRQAVERGVAQRLEITSEQRPGAWLELHVRPSGEGAGIFFRDITGRKRAEREAERNRRLLQSSLDALSTQIAILDGAGRVIAANKAWEARPGPRAPSGADVGADFLSFRKTSGDDAERLRRALKSVLSGERKSARLAYSAGTVAGRRWFQLSAARFAWDGETRVIVANEDLTDVRQAREALSELTGRLTSLREEERQRIAQELHDSTAQHLVAATLNLMTLKAKAVAYPGVHKQLETVEASLEEATRELRVFTYLLHPLALENDGLERTLRTYLEGFAKRTGLQAELSVAGQVEDLPFALRCALLRIIQEALANVHRHAQAAHVWVSLGVTAGALNLTVGDDGRGMCGTAGEAEPGAAGSGVGIPGMRARLREYGGTLSIDSGPHGTKLNASVPLATAKRRSRTHEHALFLSATLDGTSHRS